MIPSSATCGCSGTSTSTSSSVSGAFGCSGQTVPCITVSNGIITGALNTTLSPISGSAGCSGNYVPCITVTNGIVTALSNREIGVGSAGRNQSTTIIGFDSYTTWTYESAPTFLGDSEHQFITDFVPTNARISLWSAGGFDEVYIDIAYSLDGVNFTPLNINLQLGTTADVYLTKTGSFSIPNSPTYVYWRYGHVNTSGSQKQAIINAVTVNLWA